MQRVGAANLRPCSCPGRLSLLRGHKQRRNSDAHKTCMKANTFQVEIDVPEGIPVDEVMKRFKNESRRVNTVGEVRRRRYFECHQDLLKRKEKQKHMNKRMAKFDKFTPRLEDRMDPQVSVPFGEMFGQGIDDMIGGGEFGPGSLFGSGSSLFSRTIDNPDSEAKSDKSESPVGRWGSRRASENGTAPKGKARNGTDAPLTARARKAAQAVNAQGKQSLTPGAKNQPKQKQQQSPNSNGAGAAVSNGVGKGPANGATKAKGTGAASQAPKGQAPAPKKRWQAQRQKKARAPGAAETNQAQASTPSEGAPVQKKQPVAV